MWTDTRLVAKFLSAVTKFSLFSFSGNPSLGLHEPIFAHIMRVLGISLIDHRSLLYDW
jgi:hypothetical protein